MQNKTIDQLNIEGQILDNLKLEEVGSNINSTIVPTSVYSPSKAVKYAYSHAYDKTVQAYGYFPGANCTNFVSQAVKAGGKSMKLPSNINSIASGAYSNSNYQFNKFYDVGSGIAYRKEQKYSTSWTTVAGFYNYWYKHNAKTMEYTTRKSLEKI